MICRKFGCPNLRQCEVASYQKHAFLPDVVFEFQARMSGNPHIAVFYVTAKGMYRPHPPTRPPPAKRRSMPAKQVRKRGRPVEKPMPEKIDRDPEYVAEVLMKTPVKDNHRWWYLAKKSA